MCSLHDRPLAILALLLALLLALAGCGPSSAPAGGESDSDASSSGDASTAGDSESEPTTTQPGTSSTTTATGPAGIDVSGAYLTAVATSIDSTHPLFSLVTVDGSFGPDGGVMDVTTQALEIMLGETTPQPVLVGDPVLVEGVAISALGEFSLALPSLLIPGAANPITGSDIGVNLVLDGAFQHPVDEVMCGDAEGEVFEPLMASLVGSTFAGVKVAGLDALPPTSPSMCP
ncbi:MAG: hypothetical protein H6713_31370 [Myxococcales bacterium]|nr:hypothetical protein [Myxococcales bacterium]